MATKAARESAELTTQCCVVGGGPAGMMLGLLLARAGVETTVLEKHGDFLRDFRGDTIHPSTLEVMREIGDLEGFLALPHQKVTKITGIVGGVPIEVADFATVPTHCRFVAFIPQWDFLDYLADKAKAYPTFSLRMRTSAEALVMEDGRVTGVMARGPEGPLRIRAALVVDASGRDSPLRGMAGFRVKDYGAPMDVLWMRLPHFPGDPDQPFGYFTRGRILVTLYRGDYWQCAYVIPKGGIDVVKGQGIARFRQSIAEIAPMLKDRIDALQSWDDVKLLTVKVDRLESWCREGFLCIGDAAHAMSPVGGVGINLAIQDAVAAANILAEDLQKGKAPLGKLREVQERRELPTKLTQWVQLRVQNGVIGRVLADVEGAPATLDPDAWPLRLLRAFPGLRAVPARLIGVGVRPEHVRVPDVFAPAARA